MLDDFMVRALLAGVGLALVAGPLGCFVVWRRMAYFGDTLAHSALLGVALGIFLEVHVLSGVLLTGLVLTVILSRMQRFAYFSVDTSLGILSHVALAAGLVLFSLMETVRVDLFGYLFGDILAVSLQDVFWIFVLAATSLSLLALIWRALLLVTINKDIAQIEGINVARIHFVFMLLIAFVVAVAMKVVGILLVTALLIIPAAAARSFSRSPEQMAVVAIIIGSLAVILGLVSSLYFDIAAGPAIVLMAGGLFLLSLMVGQK